MLLNEIVARNARKAPNRVAVVVDDPDGGDAAASGVREITYGELHERMQRLANALLGVAAPGDRIGILAENVPEYIECYFGVPAAGMALTFLNYRLNPKEWAWILSNAEASVLIVERKFLAQVETVVPEMPSVRHVVVIGGRGEFSDGAVAGAFPAAPSRMAQGLTDYHDFVGAGANTPPAVQVNEDDTAWLIYTSGTTGFPKGAMLTHRNLVAAAIESVIEYEPIADERTLMAFPLCHVAGYTVTVTMLRGGLIVLMRAYEAGRWMELVDKHAITGSGVAPTMMNFLLQHPDINTRKLSSLRGIGYGAAAMPVEVLRAAIARFGPIVYSGFGMTELGGNVLTFPKSAHVRAVNGEEHLLASCGTPMCLADVKVVDDAMNECPPGVVGEIIVQSEQVLKGYWRNESGTAAAFEGGWFRTGDLARRDEEGFFYIVDRMKDMIITGGENVYSREVEEAIYTHPAVSEAAVIGLPDATWGERVVAVVVLRAGAGATEADIVRVCRERLAGYKSPKQVLFEPELPKTVSGKIIKRELRDRYAQLEPS